MKNYKIAFSNSGFYKIAIVCIAINCLLGCSSGRLIPKYSFSDDYYRSAVFGKKKERVYVDNSGDSILVYKLSGTQSKTNTASGVKQVFPQEKSVSPIPVARFTSGGFDIDFLTIPFKFRPVVESFPAQFNAALNGAVYTGYRKDIYKISYRKTPIGTYNRSMLHFGYSFGFFTGLGGTPMNSSVTNSMISIEYDGLVWSKGIALIAGVDNFTIGLALGWDNLLDKNHSIWIYQSKPWLGLAFGLNLN